MIILPDKNIPRSKILIPVKNSEWRTPSLAQPKDQFGNENCTKFFAIAKSNDGVPIWVGCFDDRNDYDAFAWALAKGTLQYEKELWNLCTPNWQPWMGELLSYEFIIKVYLTNAPTYNSATQSSYIVPTDWNNTNTIEAIGAGGSSGIGLVTADQIYATGGGGGAYSRINNRTLIPGSAITYVVGNRAPVDTYTTAGQRAGKTGMDTYFDGANFAVSACGAKGGSAGASSIFIGPGGGAGGSAAASIGSTKYSGGRGGNAGGGYYTMATGGGGAGGPNGAGNNGGDLTNITAASSGGSGGAGSGGSGGGVLTAGGNGSDFATGFGSGGGGGGFAYANPSVKPGTPITSAAGGNYGGGGGALAFNNLPTTYSYSNGIGTQGIIVLTYDTQFRYSFNSPMVGL